MNRVIDALSKKNAQIIRKILTVDRLMDDFSGDFLDKDFVKGLEDLGVEKYIFIKNGIVYFSEDKSLEKRRIKINNIEKYLGSGIYKEKSYKLVKKIFGNTKIGKFKLYKIDSETGFAIAFNADTLEYEISLVDMLFKSFIRKVRDKSSCYLKLKMAMKLLYVIDRETYMHSFRTKEYSKLLAAKLGFDKNQIDNIKVGAMLHDIGKLLIPFNILKKDDKISNREFELIKIHPLNSYYLLKTFGFNDEILNIALKHHEKIDGSGYPFGERNIPLNVQVVGISDILDAIQSSRSYKESTGYNNLIKEIKKFSNRYDDKVILGVINLIKSDSFVVLRKKFLKRVNTTEHSLRMPANNELIEKINNLRSKNRGLKNELQLYKNMMIKLQEKYEEAVELYDALKSEKIKNSEEANLGNSISDTKKG